MRLGEEMEEEEEEMAVAVVEAEEVVIDPPHSSAGHCDEAAMTGSILLRSQSSYQDRL
jgi:hypothetical protein